MTGRSGSGWFDVTLDGKTIGFVTGPRLGSGNWECYLELPGKTSRHLGQAPNKQAAKEKVTKAWKRFS